MCFSSHRCVLKNNTEAVCRSESIQMRKCFLLGFLLLYLPALSMGQSYTDSIQDFRKHYIADLLAEPRHPVSASQAKNISFFTPNRSYCVLADLSETPGAKPFLIPTHSGKQKPFREYGKLTFYLHDVMYTLHVYQSISMLNDTAHNDELFIPFNDLTNYDLTYGGGRYIDLSVHDISNGKILLDFNKCYNPYCAYSDGFSCPIPPAENSLQTEIRAGEKAFQH